MIEEHLNITETDLAWVDPYTYFGFWSKIAAVFVYILFQSYGSLLYVGIISFELNGGDPQKRGLINQVLSQTCGQIILEYTITAPITLWRYVVGPSNSIVFWLWCVWLRGFVYQVSISYSVGILTRFLSIVVYKTVLPILDDFIAVWIFGTSIIVSLILAVTDCYTSWAGYLLMKHQGLPRDMAPYTPLDFNLAGIVIFFVLALSIFASLGIGLESRKTQDIAKHSSFVQGNNVAYNGNVTTLPIMITLGLFGSAVVLAMPTFVQMSMDDEKTEKIMNLLKADLSHFMFIMGILPSIIYVKNHELRAYVFSYIKNIHM